MNVSNLGLQSQYRLLSDLYFLTFCMNKKKLFKKIVIKSDIHYLIIYNLKYNYISLQKDTRL